ncbi:SPASM domain-containing protein [Klebsiella aerogenes]|nr:SPASM domain-containing protein [Klebsiella aerogenes]
MNATIKRCQPIEYFTSECSKLCRSHCFYLDRVHTYLEYKTCDMDTATLQLYIRQQINTKETDSVLFSWQDSELTSDSFDFFNQVIELQKQFAQDKSIINTVLTNSALLDNSWCEFFKKNNFIISIPVNVDVSTHNNFCKTVSGKPTVHQIEESVSLLQKHGVDFSTLTSIDAINSQQPLRVYHYLKNLGSQHMQFIPLLEPIEQGGVSARSLAPAAFGTFLKTIFYTWVRLDIGTIKIPIFEQAFAAWCELPTANRIFSPSENDTSALKTNDDLYQHNHFAHSKTLRSNSRQSVITRIQKNKTVGQHKPLLAAECVSCKMEFACRGGCPKDRIVFSQRGAPELNYFCESYLAFFTYVEPYMLMMRALWEQNYAPSDIRQYLA